MLYKANEAKKLMKLISSRGFTLIELLVVVAIIGILASVILVSLGSARAKARDARRISDVKQIQSALELYFSSQGQYPVTLTPLSPTYIRVVPTDPLTGASYFYAGLKLASDSSTSPKCLSYHLGASLEASGADSPVMKTDSDAAKDTNASATQGGSSCGGGVDFEAREGSGSPSMTGKNCSAAAGTDATAEYCFDVTP